MSQGREMTSFLGRVFGWGQSFFIYSENTPPKYVNRFGNPENFSLQGGYLRAANELVGWVINNVPFSLRNTEFLGDALRTIRAVPLDECQLRFLRATYSFALANYFINLSANSEGRTLSKCSENRNGYQSIRDVPDPFREFAL